MFCDVDSLKNEIGILEDQVRYHRRDIDNLRDAVNELRAALEKSDVSGKSTPIDENDELDNKWHSHTETPYINIKVLIEVWVRLSDGFYRNEFAIGWFCPRRQWMYDLPLRYKDQRHHVARWRYLKPLLED